MIVHGLSRAVKRITILDVSGGRSEVLVGKKGKRKKSKRQTRLFKPAERLTRRVSKGGERAVEKYTKEHRRSNRKRRDGWIRDFPVNVARAQAKGWNQLLRWNPW